MNAPSTTPSERSETPSERSETLRERNLARLDGGNFDVVVIGGGINGAVSAAAVAARGLSVAVIDRGDFGSSTSQESSNLIWGGFKYLENYELLLVAKLCRSRNQLLKAYPSRIGRLRFLATLDSSAPFPSWLAALGTLGYWGIGLFATDPPAYHRARAIKKAEPIITTDTAEAAIEYGDAYLKDNDARFVWGFVRSALDSGAVAANYVELESAVLSDTQSLDDHGSAMGQETRWSIAAHDRQSGRQYSFTARALVNAAGPYVDGINRSLDVKTDHRIVYSKGIHLVVPKLTDNERVLAFFDDSQRLFYVIPMANRSVIGTTDTRTTNPDEKVTDDDRHYLLKQINARLDLANPLTVDDIISERCGVRPLVVEGSDDETETDWTALSRKHEIEVDADRAVVSILGGKLTDCLNVGDEVVDAIDDLGIPLGEAPRDNWYGEPSAADRAAFAAFAETVGLDRAPDVERESTIGDVLWRRHGLAANEVAAAIAKDPNLGRPVLAGADILAAELPLYAEREMIVTIDDFLRRRTKLAMLQPDDELAADPGMPLVARALGVSL